MPTVTFPGSGDFGVPVSGSGGGGGTALTINIDQRTGLTSADAAATTLFTATVGGHFLEVIFNAICTAYTSGSPVYTLSWTEGGVAHTLNCTVNATGPFRDFALIQPDAATTVTVQLTGTFTATLDVGATCKVIV